MEIITSDLDDASKRVTLVGKLDIAGAGKIEAPLAAVAESGKNVVVDMAGVDFIASIGIRHLVMAARTLSRANRKLLLFNPTPLVTEVLVTAGLQGLLPVVRSEDEARAALRG